MKRVLFFSFVAVALTCCTAYSQLNVWRWQNPLPAGDILHAVQMFSLNNIYACGENGVFMSSADGGESWNVQTNIFKFKGTFTTLSFTTPQFGMIAGDSGRALKTTDGGITWSQMQSKTTFRINGILVVDTLVALFVTKDGNIFKTIDGGINWQPVPSEGNPELWSIRMLRPDFIAVTGNNGFLVTSNDQFSTPYKTIKVVVDTIQLANTFYYSNFTDDNTCTLLGDDGLILHTTDGGNTWIKQSSGANNSVTATLHQVDGKDLNMFGIAGDYGTLLYTSDGGGHWQQSFIGTIGNLYGISFFDKLNATAVGRDGVILKTTDGGQDWFYVPRIPQVTLLLSVAFPKGDTSLGIAVGYYGVIMRTTNGGKDWKVIPTGWNHALRCVTFLDSVEAIAVGDYGAMLKSTDAGITWNRIQQFTSNNLFSVSFATPSDGLAVGDSNTVLKTTTRGEVWTTDLNPGAFYIDSGTSPKIVKGYITLLSVSYPDKKHAFIGTDENFYWSNDGGIIWIDSFVFKMIKCISFSDSIHGSEVFTPMCEGCTPQYVDFTEDGGKNWINLHQTGDIRYNNLNCIYSIDRFHATAVGNGGYIGHTTDGGVTWNQQQSNTPNNLYGVSFGTVKAGTSVGMRGNIMRITTDEQAASSVQRQQDESEIGIEAYPNPASGTITISYSVPSARPVTIALYSIEGKLISSLPEIYQSAGKYSLNFNTSGLASGTYICRISEHGIVAEKEIIIRK